MGAEIRGNRIYETTTSTITVLAATAVGVVDTVIVDAAATVTITGLESPVVRTLVLLTGVYPNINVDFPEGFSVIHAGGTGKSYVIYRHVDTNYKEGFPKQQ